MDDLLVDSSPSKEFFISMITKDVTVESCILDLIDNSIDAHKKLNDEKKESVIDINYSLEEDYFQIIDDCGGMSKDNAMYKAFRFGNQSTRDSQTLGMYGIGMKRSIFKIGKDFIVQSKTDVDSFQVYMNRKEWLELKDGEQDIWKFHFADEKYDFNNGVHIYINGLCESLRLYLRWEKNIASLKEKIGSAYRDQLSKNITIKLNGNRIIYTPDMLDESDLLSTYVKTKELENVNIKIIAGISKPFPKDAGWSIICNGRYVIEYDKTELTGWDSPYDLDDDENIDEVLGKKKTPAYHNDFARFRGYVILESEDPNQLPLNTTKDGIDKQHPIYQHILFEMTNAMELILPKLRELQKIIRICKNEQTVPPDEAFKPIKFTDFLSMTTRSFKLDLDAYHAPEKMKNIPVYIEAKKVAQLKKYFEVETNRELGEGLLNFVNERVIFDE